MSQSLTVSPAMPAPPLATLAQLTAYAFTWFVFVFREIRERPLRGSPTDWLHWLLAADPVTLLWIVLLGLAPVAWRVRAQIPRFVSAKWATLTARASAAERGSTLRGWISSLMIAAVSFGVSATVARPFRGLPPAYHDEYSYLLQAQTFLAGRVAFKSPPAAPLFDQTHVLNEGMFASRYFPGTGLWMAPFVAWGHPLAGHWLAGAIAAMLLFWTGRELGGDVCGLIAGLLTALSPGMALFSNHLLAHHPTLVGLGFFLLGYFRCTRLCSARWAFISGAGLAFAALCRPMTACGISIPFGVDFLIWFVRGAPVSQDNVGLSAGVSGSPRWSLIVSMGLPLLAAGATMLLYDRAITGNVWKTPYGLYTEVYTPRHVYGFNNGIRGDQRQGPKVLVNYDQWAENLTPRLAWKQSRLRIISSGRWTLGLLPLSLALVAGLFWWQSLPTGTRLILPAIVSLHAAHVPYWFAGIEGFHYVFESIPLWCLWCGAVTVCAARAWTSQHRAWMPAWWGLVLISAVGINYTSSAGLWASPLPSALSRAYYGREKHGHFFERVAREVQIRPALVLVEWDPANVHVEYVTNSPTLQDEIIYGHYRPWLVPLAEIERAYPGRALYLYRSRDDRFVRLK